MGDTWFKKDIFHVNRINLPAGRVTIFEENVIANDIIANHAHIIIANDNLVLSGDLTSNNLLLVKISSITV
ncbi:MAG: hypothetical protein RCG15_05110 [Candidatus Rickettsia vulgarisii]